MWLWIGHAMYLGPSLRLDPHSGSVHCFALGVDGDFRLEAAGFGSRMVRSALVPPRTTHRVVAGERRDGTATRGERSDGTAEARMLFCYLDPGSVYAGGCRGSMSADAGGFGLGHRREAELIRTAGGADPDPAALLDLACGHARVAMDPRIAVAVATIRADPGGRLTAAELAREADLSVSRFLHLFSGHTGTSFRRYRRWARMVHVGRAVAKGADLTTAAVEAGFASPSHFSDQFHAMCGLSATALFATGAEIVVLD